MTASSATFLHRGLAFLAGVGFAAVPTVGPYLAILGLVSGRFEVQRADRWWWAAAALLGLPWLATGHAWAAFGATGQALAVWLIFRSASLLRSSVGHDTFPKDVGAGLLIGFAGAIALGLDRAGDWRLDTARSVFDLVAWTGSPSLFGHAMLVLAALLSVALPSPRGRVLALALGAGAVLLSGAQEAVLAWLFIAVGLRFVGRRGSRGTVAAEWVLVALMVLVATGATTLVGAGRTGFRIDLAPPPPGANALRGTEVPTGDWWYPLGVRFEAAAGVVGGEERTVYSVTKADTEPWARLQQIVELAPGTAYVVAVSWRADGAAFPGIDGWGRARDDGAVAHLAATWAEDAWRASAEGALSVAQATVLDLGDGWRRGVVAFRHEGTTPLTWYVGAVPDRRATSGTTTEFAELQLTVGETPAPYAPGPDDRGLADLRTTRWPIWSTATTGIAARPWLGWGPTGYQEASRVLDPRAEAQRPNVAHAHSLALDVAIERGLVGLVGLAVLASMLALRAVQQRDRAAAIVMLGILILNLFDATLLNGAVIYPLAAVLGWRAVGHRSAAQARAGAGTAMAVRVGLAAGDALVALSGLMLVTSLSQGGPFAWNLAAWPTTMLYATLLWPAAAWVSHLYPGYGMAPHDELARSVRAAASASVAFGFLLLMAPGEAPVSGLAIALLGAWTAVVAPIARYFVKSGLRWACLWGRPIAILGSGIAAERIARHLLDRPEIGLRPVAVFGNDASVWKLEQLPILGSIDAAWRTVRLLGLQHVIVVPDAANAPTYDEVLRRLGRSVRAVQWVPNLPGLPTSAVTGAPIGTTLGLEARNNLASAVNRTFKRSFDLAAVLVGGALIAPIVLALVVAIRLDSRGAVLYRQRRLGRYGRHFHVWKFRSMVQDAEQRLIDLLAHDPAARAEWDATQKLVDDPRVTRVGRFLRRTSLDELPQLWNVLTGEMSLVGPRPIVDAEVPKYGDAFDLYTQVRPGMTGAWQVSGRSDTSYAYRVDLDAAYVRNWSLWLDIDILLRTVGVVLRREGAY